VAAHRQTPTLRGLTPSDATRVSSTNRSAMEDEEETAVGWVDDEAQGGIDLDGDPEAEVKTECCWRFVARVGLNSSLNLTGKMVGCATAR